MKLLHSGKVRDIYSDRGDIVLVASDRLSVFDVVLPTPVPDKGKILTALSLWWFDKVASLVPHHVLSSTDVPEEFAGRAVRCRRLEMLPVECVARGYLTGGGLKEYRETGTVSGVALPPGLEDGSRLPEPIFTPSSKAPAGQHDEAISFDEVTSLVGVDTATRIRELTLEVYRLGAEITEKNGILLADTKLEFGRDASGEIVLGDEVLTPDSSRFWPADQWEPGRPQYSFDKQYAREWALSTGWDKTPPGPEVPPEVVEAVRARYAEVYERITGTPWP
ncbi:phosphoribosylaminoimidazolesuccinocarboxamide synthase [Pseudonocardia pini]|uniref:phosphoribosylaminoimidazolesuccinocarboxamide synthase n=1 Tax=Pseudonocardia pini TaxID=2758030 RepID=UPI0015F0390E|nr:phosphoribosylaminoimidazolesuccinocarboxamide synthase [Pseudonocardia pini]